MACERGRKGAIMSLQMRKLQLFPSARVAFTLLWKNFGDNEDNQTAANDPSLYRCQKLSVSLASQLNGWVHDAFSLCEAYGMSAQAYGRRVGSTAAFG
ncbi:hypothetical protein Nepgr_028054 [Nepenthes gracilis]|uniref:Uncharacterized protein n=1 Tax=Nepenthes gracilis TaxID=150966 RepID=A0AAD3TCF8_NEPGR|nr:hypothetical protein Nepgr_028054 [Nepenthes gracilis]